MFKYVKKTGDFYNTSALIAGVIVDFNSSTANMALNFWPKKCSFNQSVKGEKLTLKGFRDELISRACYKGFEQLDQVHFKGDKSKYHRVHTGLNIQK